MDKAKYVNMLIFMERVSVVGKESLAWVETYQAVRQQITLLDAMDEAVRKAQGESK